MNKGFRLSYNKVSNSISVCDDTHKSYVTCIIPPPLGLSESFSQKWKLSIDVTTVTASWHDMRWVYCTQAIKKEDQWLTKPVENPCEQRAQFIANLTLEERKSIVDGLSLEERRWIAHNLTGRERDYVLRNLSPEEETKIGERYISRHYNTLALCFIMLFVIVTIGSMVFITEQFRLYPAHAFFSPMYNSAVTDYLNKTKLCECVTSMRHQFISF